MPMFKANQYLVDTVMPFTTGGGGMSKGGPSETAPAGNSVESVEQQESRQHYGNSGQHVGNSGHEEDLSYDELRALKEQYQNLYVDLVAENYQLKVDNRDLERVATWVEHTTKLDNDRLQAENEDLQAKVHILEKRNATWERVVDELTHDLNMLAAENKRLQEENERRIMSH